ncbi:E3 ubiquitin/ISG15 ligase TRIM25-like [Hyla sarda]|uniref:E3 ubiquitin/ISG15 ligase TRIM25-like n=1 Tax=Hyla sarda TaxID=327740 RepID=UPI0024C334E2|nr:E3 ubiquitin/ISG15 ligase TRIM25-like [Hyla sarda]
MAYMFLKKEITCSLCSAIYTDPVLLHCGHNFCSDCIKTHICNHDRSGVYLCPECKQASKSKAPLTINTALQNIAQKCQSVENHYSLGDSCCTYCLEYQSPAVKICLHCESSLCERHLQVHSKTSEHLLADITFPMQKRICSLHGEILKFFCTDDKTVICMLCFLSGDHQRHGVELLEEASRHKIEELQEMAGHMETELGRLKKRTNTLNQQIKVNKESVEEVKDTSKNLCSSLLNYLRDVTKNLETDINDQEIEVFKEITDEIMFLEEKQKRLSLKMKKIVDLCNQDDPLLVLQDKTPLKRQKTEHRRRLPILHYHFDTILFSLKLKRSFENFAKLVQALLSTQCPHLKHKADILLDVLTASNYLTVSSNLKAVGYVSIKSEHGQSRSGQFKTCHVLSKTAFLFGKHCWEVKTSKKGTKSIGVAYPSIKKEGPDSFIGYNQESWCLTWSHEYTAAFHNSQSWQITSEGSAISSVAVYLDYDAGQLSFYRTFPTVEHLFTFMAKFNEPLHAIFYLVDSWIEIRP